VMETGKWFKGPWSDFIPIRRNKDGSHSYRVIVPDNHPCTYKYQTGTEPSRELAIETAVKQRNYYDEWRREHEQNQQEG
jgi:hypothetical protein